MPGLLWLIGGARRWRGAAGIGWLFGFGHHLAGLYWITDAILIRAADFWWAVPLAVPFLAALLAIFIAAPCALARLAPTGLPRLAVLAGTWVLADLARGTVGTGFPWNPWGSVWAFPGWAGDVMIQPAAWIGTPGLTLATIWAAGLPSLGGRGVAALVAVLAIWITAGAWRLSVPSPPPTGTKVVLVQGNVPEQEKLSAGSARETFRKYLDMTRAALKDAPASAAALWPESASPYWLLDDDPDGAASARAAREAIAAVSSGHAVLAGSVAVSHGRVFNALVTVLPDGTAGAWYAKWHLVPFGEFSPSWFVLPFKVVPGAGFTPGPGPETLTVPGLPPVGPLICYEAIYPSVTVDRRSRPAWLANITNDGWYGDTAGPRQHLAAARLRSVEQGLPMMRAANTGISAGFDARGHELGRIPWGETATLALDLPASLQVTVFASYGLALPLSLAVLSVVIFMPRNRLR